MRCLSGEPSGGSFRYKDDIVRSSIKSFTSDGACLQSLTPGKARNKSGAKYLVGKNAGVIQALLKHRLFSEYG